MAVRGGANGGPQYNPMNVSGTGGAGQAGGKAAQMTAKAQQLRPSGGGAYGATQALTQQIQQGGNVKTTAPATQPKMSRTFSTGRGAPVTPITAPSENMEEPIFAGTSLPGGVGPEGLILPPAPEGDAKFDNSIQTYAQPLQYVANQPNTSQETRNVIAMLLRQTEV